METAATKHVTAVGYHFFSNVGRDPPELRVCLLLLLLLRGVTCGRSHRTWTWTWTCSRPCAFGSSLRRNRSPAPPRDRTCGEPSLSHARAGSGDAPRAATRTCAFCTAYRCRPRSHGRHFRPRMRRPPRALQSDPVGLVSISLKCGLCRRRRNAETTHE
jgi:hypothetical protein